MKKVLAAAAAAGVLMAGAFTASVVGSEPATAQTPDETTATERGPGSLLTEVLDELVADSTIDQATADAIKEAVEAKVQEKRESGEFRHWGRRGHGSGHDFRGLLDDGVISAEELAELPDDHPLNDPDGPAADYLDDGELTEDELSEIRQSLREAHQAEREAAETSNA